MIISIGKRRLLNDIKEFDQPIKIIADACEFAAFRIKKNLEKHNILLLELSLDMLKESKVSNTHSCPIDGKKNWGWEKDLPRGYPGYSGRFRMTKSNDVPGFGSDDIERSCFHTGSGGGRGNDDWDKVYPDAYTTEYDVKMYLKDFDQLYAAYAQEILMDDVRLLNTLELPMRIIYNYEIHSKKQLTLDNV